MLWEISVLNKIYKSNSFSRIRSRVHNGHRIYVVSNKNKFSSILGEVEKGDDLKCSSDDQLLKKYGLLENKNSYLKDQSSEYLSNLYLYDCIYELGKLADISVKVDNLNILGKRRLSKGMDKEAFSRVK